MHTDLQLFSRCNVGPLLPQVGEQVEFPQVRVDHGEGPNGVEADANDGHDIGMGHGSETQTHVQVADDVGITCPVCTHAHQHTHTHTETHEQDMTNAC